MAAPGRAASVGGLTNGVAYTFTVAATNVAGTSPSSIASSAVIPLTVPGAPTSVAARPGDVRGIDQRANHLDSRFRKHTFEKHAQVMTLFFVNCDD